MISFSQQQQQQQQQQQEQQEQQQQHEFAVETMRIFFISTLIFTLIPLYRAFFWDEYGRLGFVFSSLTIGLAYRCSASDVWFNVSKWLFGFSLALSAVVIFFTNGMFASITSLWGIIFALVCYVTIEKRVGVMVAITTLAMYLLSIVSVDMGIVLPVIKEPGVGVQLIHLSFMVVIVVYAMRRFNQLTQMPLQAMQQVLAQEQHLNQQKDQLFSNMSHELRTPLNGLYGVLQAAQGKTDCDRALLKAGMQSARHLKLIIDDILDTQKLASGHLQLMPELMEPRDCLAPIQSLHTVAAQSKGIRFNCHLEPSLPVSVECDGLRVGQIINNLLSNAVKFTEQGDVTLTVGYHEQCLQITVADSGIGMDRATLDRLYDRFEQADASISKRYQGTGLGMSIVQQLVELMDGSIEVESFLGKGTTFTVTLPMRTVQSKPAFALADAKPVDVAAVNTADAAILLVDDSPVNVMVGKVMLNKHFAHVDTAEGGIEACEKCQQNCYDIVLTDIGMPDLNGEELLLKLKMSHPDIPVIAVTGNATQTDRERYLALGFCEVITKPYDLHALVNAVSVALQRPVNASFSQSTQRA